jgi:enolase-phosphatase E1
VPEAFDRWQAQGKKIAIYSSGSELAQKLLFGTTEFGDLTRQIANFFDTRVGSKRDAESYRRISAAFATPEDSFIFLSDVSEELNAARSAGMKTALVARGKAREASPNGHAIIHDFDCLK